MALAEYAMSLIFDSDEFVLLYLDMINLIIFSPIKIGNK